MFNSEEIDRIRRTIITAFFSDDALFERLALKGGNALRLVYGVQGRASLDIDLSLSDDLEKDFDDTKKRLERVLSDRLDSAGYSMFDMRLEQRPKNAKGNWGGYLLVFKVVETSRYNDLRRNLPRMQREALVLGPKQERTFEVEISKWEYCAPKISYEMDDQKIYVYSPEMIVIEKLRALCQQMPEYEKRPHGAPRPRDFYDIHAVLTQLQVSIESPENAELAQIIFETKEVPILLLRRLKDYRDFHATDWPSVQLSTTERDKGFDFYFDYVAHLVEKLDPLWIKESPSG
jgi:Nucleotidyl transferase AbiEii toxin, Type IV TA system